MNCLPRKESNLKEFAINFDTHITAAPMSYALVAGDAAQIHAAVEDFVAKYTLATQPETRTAAAIVEKDNAKATMLAILRAYARQIWSNRSVSDADKVNLGLGGVSDTVRTPVEAPTTRPMVHVTGVDVKQHELRFADITMPEKKGRPAGAAGLQVFYHVGDAAAGAPGDPLTSRFHVFTTKLKLTMSFTAADSGKTAFYYARWQTALGLVGPWSVPVGMPIAG